MHSWAAPDLPRLPGHAPPLRVHDSATGEVRPTAPGSVARLYVCGITPYDATHVGHAATYVTFDLLQRVWRDGGHAVRYVQNVTDVDDPLLERAERTGEDWMSLAEREIARFRADMTALRVLPPDDYAGVVEALPHIVDLIGRLREHGGTYEADRDTYFSVGADTRFGATAGFDMATMLELFAERGGDPDRPGKKDPLDCVLWQAVRPGAPSWHSPFGPGRPGWHVECTAIALHHLGMSFDVQGGGSDLAFPHHEMCASQAHIATGEWPFARAFVHRGMVGLDGEKMSKSRGNLVLVSALLAGGHDPMAIRLALLSRPYRADWDWTQSVLDEATERLARWRTAVALPAGPPAGGLLSTVRDHLADDLNAPSAIRAVDRWCEEARLRSGSDPAAPGLVRDMLEALLGVHLHEHPAGQ